MKQRIHLICNAHLDPVWLWEWEEGAAEALSTFRVAAELCEKNEAFIFNHNEVTLYKWVQEFEPELFGRIQKLVKAGRWHIMGGWYLQPDCNMPSGESFVRQVLQGRAYFKEHFGVEPRTAINFDPFGHTRGLVQILAKSGYDSYLFGRPQNAHLELPNDEFVWVGYDGSRILGTRFCGWYNSQLGKAGEIINERIDANSDKEVLAVLWGVGNHGGGPSRVDLEQVEGLIRRRNDRQIMHSTPEKYFGDLSGSANRLPEVKRDLNPWAVGCYSSQIRIKQAHRRLENELYMVEKMASAASVAGLMKYPYELIHEALCDLLVGEFHDILPGSSVEPAETASLRMLDHGLEILARIKAKVFFALGSGQKKARPGQIPILVYNPHPFVVRQAVECEFNLPDFRHGDDFTQIEVWQNGKALASQVEKERSNLGCEWRKRVVFFAELKPSQMNRFDCRLKVVEKKPAGTLKAKGGKITFQTDDLSVVINTRTGLIDRYQVQGREFVGKNAFRPVIFADNADPWGMLTDRFRDEVGEFQLMSKEAGTAFSAVHTGLLDSVRVIEDGPVRSVVEAVFAYGRSGICQRYKLPKKGTEVEVEILVFWDEKDKLLKLEIPTRLREGRYIGQVAYGVAELADNGQEVVSQKWSAVVSQKDDAAFACINDGSYGSDYSADGWRLTLLRSPAYSAHPNADGSISIPPDRYSPRIDQGQRMFRFWFCGGPAGELLKTIDRVALAKNEKPFALSFYPSGRGQKPKPLVQLSDEAVQITAIKRAESNDDLIIRLFEPTGTARSTTMSLPWLNKRIKVSLGGFEIKTLRIVSRTGRVEEVNLLERQLDTTAKFARNSHFSAIKVKN